MLFVCALYFYCCCIYCTSIFYIFFVDAHCWRELLLYCYCTAIVMLLYCYGISMVLEIKWNRIRIKIKIGANWSRTKSNRMNVTTQIKAKPQIEPKSELNQLEFTSKPKWKQNRKLNRNRIKNSLIQIQFICYWIAIVLLFVYAFYCIFIAIVWTVQLFFKFSSSMHIADASCYCIAIVLLL